MNSPSLSRGISVFVECWTLRHSGEWPPNEPLSAMAMFANRLGMGSILLSRIHHLPHFVNSLQQLTEPWNIDALPTNQKTVNFADTYDVSRVAEID